MQGVFKDVKAPNVYMREVDRSAYDNEQEQSEVDTNVVVCGFAQKGPNLEPRRFIRINDFIATYGYPTNEAERYFYNAADEVLTKGATLLASRLPYDNNAYERVTYCQYEVGTELKKVSDLFPELSEAYPSVVSALEVSPTAKSTGLMDFNLWDSYVTGAAKPSLNSFIIVDTAGNKFVRDDYYKDIPGEDGGTNQYLGIVPVIVSPVNAMVFQTVLSVDDESFSKYNLIRDLATIADSTAGAGGGGDVRNVVLTAVNDLSSTNFERMLSSQSITTESVGKLVIESCFPQVSYGKVCQSEIDGADYYTNELDKTYLNQIGVVVCRMYANPNNDNRVAFDVVESFVGSLNPNAKDSVTGASIYIGDKINTGSMYINFFSNVEFGPNKPATEADIIAVSNQTIYSMGFFESDTVDDISYKKSIVDGLNKVFGKLDDTRSVKIDLVIDAGVSNIAQFLKQTNASGERGKYDPLGENGIKLFTLDSATNMVPYTAVCKQFENFCRFTRSGDCMFIEDAPRPLSLIGNSKIVRQSQPMNTVSKSILPKLKYIPPMNSCFAAGYAVWFMVLDRINKVYVWVPPSVKAVGRYIYTDRVARPWYAPAGLNRGIIDNVFDISFNPKNSEAGVLYSNSWNYAVNTTFNGVIQEGQRTFQLKATALDRVNVRRLMSEIEKRVISIARRYLYEPLSTANLVFFENDVSKYLSKVQTGEGIEEYVVIADETNNNANTIDNNELHCTVGVRPIKSIEYIFLTFVTTNQSVNVRESTMSVMRGQIQ